MAGKRQKLAPKICQSPIAVVVHFYKRAGGNGLDNAIVLCFRCQGNRDASGTLPVPFSEETKKEALARADGKCECANSHCHD